MEYKISLVVFFPESREKGPRSSVRSFETDDDETAEKIFRQFIEEEKGKVNISARGIEAVLFEGERKVTEKNLMFEKSVIETTITPGRGWIEPKDWIYEVQISENIRRRSSY